MFRRLNGDFGEYSFSLKVIAFLIIIGFIISIIVEIQKNTGSSNNIDLFFNYFIVILIFAICFGFIFKINKSYEEKNKIIEETTPYQFLVFYKEFKKYAMIFLLYFLFIWGLYIFNPFDIMTKYGGPLPTFIFLFIGFVILVMIFGLGWFTDPKNRTSYEKFKADYDGNIFLFYRFFVILPCLGIICGLLYWIIKVLGFLDEDNDKTSKHYIISTIVNILILIGMFAIIYKAIIASGIDWDIPLLSLIFNIIFYIPCLLINLIEFIVGFFRQSDSTGTGTTASDSILSAFKPVFGPTTKNDLILLGISTSLCGLYLLMNYVIIPYSNKKYYKQGGTQLINKPISTNVLTNITTYQLLNGSEKIDYKYAFSFWFYIDSFTNSTNTSYLNSVPIFSFGDNPLISYYAPTNSLMITTIQPSTDDAINSVQTQETTIKKENIELWNSIQSKIKSGIDYIKTLPIGNEYDEKGNRIIYKKSGILLQKWNNIVINYNGGTLDVFYNGELVKSSIEVVPKILFNMPISVGSNNGIGGSVANLLYFKEPLDILTINRLYISLKNKNPPSIAHIDKTLIPLP
jgi:hypothetical protein